MPGLLGTEVVRHVEYHPHQISTPACLQHAAAAFKPGALNYSLEFFGLKLLALTPDRGRGEYVVVRSYVSFSCSTGFRAQQRAMRVANA